MVSVFLVVLQFDNSYSWFYGKEIQFYGTVEKPDSELLDSLPGVKTADV